VNDLAANATGQTSIQLTWTAVGDDGNVGTATLYDLRYLTGAGCSVTAANFGTASIVSGLNAPQAAGTAESFTVGGLTSNTTYCFALQVSDAAGNSSLSNSASATTAGTPSQQITNIRQAIHDATATPVTLPSLPLTGVVVSYVKDGFGGALAGAADGPGFFVQNDATGPALWFPIDPTTIAPGGLAVGDVLDLVVTQGAWQNCSSCSADNSTYAVTAATGNRVGTGGAVPSSQDLSNDPRFASAIQTPVGPTGWDIDAELVNLNVTVAGPFGSGGAGFLKANITSAGAPTASANFDLRLSNTLELAQAGLFQGCQVTVQNVPMWRFNLGVELSAWVPADLTNVTCPATAVTSTAPADQATAVDVGSTVTVNFNAPMNSNTLTAQTLPGPCSGSIQVSTDNFATCIGFASAAPIMTVNNTVATLTPSPALSYGSTYQIQVTTAAQATNGQFLGSAFLTPSGFTTGLPGNSCSSLTTGALVISQVYGGGGNSSATYQNDFVELHNRSSVPISLNGLSIQYASAAGTFSAANTFALPTTGVVPAGGYYLIQLAGSTTNGVALPTPDATMTTAPINMSGTNGKVALVNGTAPIAACNASNVLDLIGYGTANCAEGTATAALANNTSAQRNGGGCSDTNNNSSDFTVTTPLARNSQTAASQCSCAAITTANETNAANEANYCVLQFPQSTLTVQTGTTTQTIYGRLYEAGVTPSGGTNANIQAQAGYGPTNANPEDQGGWVWTNATYNNTCGSCGNNDEYMSTLTAPAPGSYFYAYRFSVDQGATWTYCDINGAGSNAGLTFEITQLPLLNVTP
jgi:hypothetical protein